ncbi:MAG: S41 family peptidase [Fulvivirga sp.]|uniref:S41 family peptidase n=1 Tax=Fulvivirga sp. TaxID=1931237 RepID=UPI0032F13954
MLSKLSFLIILLFLVSCQEQVDPSNKLAVYDELCTSIAKYSASIEARNVNWDSLTLAYRLSISNSLSEDEYFEIVGELLRNFKDPHVWLIAPKQSMYTIDYLNYERNFSKELILSQYIEQLATYNSSIFTGMISGSIGYVFCANFKGDVTATNRIFSDIIERFENTKGLIIDLRINDGGNVYNAQNLLNKLTQKRSLWHTTQNKTKNGLDRPYEWHIEPDNTSNYKNKVVVLTGRYTVSAGERFVIGAKLLDHVTIVGDTTANTQGSVMGREMLNGWQYTFTFEKVLDAKGVNHAGVGIAPDCYIPSNETIIKNNDQAIERAIEIIME